MPAERGRRMRGRGDGRAEATSISGIALGPRRFERAASCPCGYALEPMIDEIRAEAAQPFPWATAG